MASESASQLIIFIASILIAASVSALLITQTLAVSDASRASVKQLAQEIRDDITIINDPANVPYNSTTGNLTLYVKNTGSSTMPADGAIFDVLIDGQYQSDLSASLIQGTGTWGPGEVMRLNVTTGGLGAGDYTVRVIARSVNDQMEIRR